MMDAALRRADEHILGADFMNDQGIERAPGQYPVNDPTFTRDRHLLKTSAGGNGRRLNRPRALYLNAMTGLLAALGGTSDVESITRYAHCSRGFWEQTHSGPGTRIGNGRPFFSRGCRQRSKCKQKYRE